MNLRAFLLLVILATVTALTAKEMKGMKIRELKKVLADRGVKCKGCATKQEYTKRVKETNHLDKPKRSDDEEGSEWMVETGWMVAKGLFAASPLLLLGGVFCCAFESEEEELAKRKKRDDFKAGSGEA